MSLAHMPPAFQFVYGVLWVASAVVAVSMVVAEPLSAPLTPIPQIITIVIVGGLARGAYLEIKQRVIHG